MECRAGCGACCVALSISSSIPGTPDGKPAGVRCIQLTPGNLCRIYGQSGRPAVCNRLRPNEEMCGQTADHAFAWLEELDRVTCPELPTSLQVNFSEWEQKRDVVQVKMA